jgi:hypothetical protein
MAPPRGGVIAYDAAKVLGHMVRDARFAGSSP